MSLVFQSSAEARSLNGRLNQGFDRGFGRTAVGQRSKLRCCLQFQVPIHNPRSGPMPSDRKSTGESPLVYATLRRPLIRGDRVGRIDDYRLLIADF